MNMDKAKIQFYLFQIVKIYQFQKEFHIIFFNYVFFIYILDTLNAQLVQIHIFKMN